MGWGSFFDSAASSTCSLNHCRDENKWEMRRALLCRTAKPEHETYLGVELGRVLWVPLLRLVVDVRQAEPSDVPVGPAQRFRFMFMFMLSDTAEVRARDSPLEVVEEAPREVGADVDAVLPHGREDGGGVALEVLHAVVVGECPLDWHGVLVLHGEAVLGDTDKMRSSAAPGARGFGGAY